MSSTKRSKSRSKKDQSKKWEDRRSPRGVTARKYKKKSTLLNYLITKEKEATLAIHGSDSEMVTSNKQSASSVTQEDQIMDNQTRANKGAESRSIPKKKACTDESPKENPSKTIADTADNGKWNELMEAEMANEPHSDKD